MQVGLQKVIGWIIAGLSVLFSLLKLSLYLVGLSTTLEDTEALPEKGRTMLKFIAEQPAFGFYGFFSVLAVLGLWLALRNRSFAMIDGAGTKPPESEKPPLMIFEDGPYVTRDILICQERRNQKIYRETHKLRVRNDSKKTLTNVKLQVIVATKIGSIAIEGHEGYMADLHPGESVFFKMVCMHTDKNRTHGALGEFETIPKNDFLVIQKVKEFVIFCGSMKPNPAMLLDEIANPEATIFLHYMLSAKDVPPQTLRLDLVPNKNWDFALAIKLNATP